MSEENYRRRLRAVLRLAGVRRAEDSSGFEQAFVHQSYAKERGGASNDRMEFLGDSVLGCIAAGWLFERFAEEPEGLLTLRKAAIVNDAQLARTARRLRLGALIRLGAGMVGAGGAENTSVLADAFEALVGALYVRFGLEKARKFVNRCAYRAARSFVGCIARCEDAIAALHARASRRHSRVS